MRRPVVHLAWSDPAWRPFRIVDGRRHALLCRVASDGYWLGPGMVLTVGWLMLWVQWPQRFVPVVAHA